MFKVIVQLEGEYPGLKSLEIKSSTQTGFPVPMDEKHPTALCYHHHALLWCSQHNGFDMLLSSMDEMLILFTFDHSTFEKYPVCFMPNSKGPFFNLILLLCNVLSTDPRP